MNEFEIKDSNLIKYTSDEKIATIPDGVTVIGEKAFSFCEKLKIVTVPEGVECISDYAFYNCEEIRKVDISSTVRTIGSQAFYDSSELELVTFHGPVEEIADNAFHAYHVKTDFNTFVCTERILPNTLTTFHEHTKIENKSLSYLVVYQNSKEWKEFEDSKCFGREEEVAHEIINLLEVGTITENIARNVGEFVTRNGIFIHKQTIQEVYSLIYSNGFDTIANELKENEITRRVFEDNDIDYNPIEEFVRLNLKNNNSIKKIQKEIKQGVHYKNSEEVCSISVIAYAISEYESQKDEFFRDLQFKVKADRVANALNKTELAEVAKSNGYYMAFCRFGDESQISSFISKHEKGYDWMTALLLSDTRAAMKELDKRKRLDWYAEIRRIDEDTIRDQVMTDVGLDSEGKKVYSIGTKRIQASLNNELQYDLTDLDTGETVTAFPSKNVDKEILSKAKGDFALLKRNTKNMFRERVRLLSTQFLSGTSIECDRWVNLYRENPVLKPIAETIVWEQNGLRFIVNNDRCVDRNGDEYNVSDSYDSIRVAHPIDMTGAEIKSWQDYFINNKIKQPFSQIWEPVIIRKKDEMENFIELKISEDVFNNIKKALSKRDIKTGRTTMLSSEQEITASVGYYIYLTGYYKQIDKNNIMIQNFKKYTNEKAFEESKRYINAVLFEYYKGSIVTSILNKGSVSEDTLDKFTMDQILDFIKIANQAKNTNANASLLNYRNKKYGQYDFIEELVLDL